MSPPWQHRWLLLALLLTALPAYAEPPAARRKAADSKPVSQPDIELLVRRLGSDSFADREEAMKELRRLGKPALDALRRAAANSTDAEIRRRAAALLDQLLDPPYSKLYRAGVQLLEKKEYLKARTTLSEAAELYRKDPTIPRADTGVSDQPVLAEIYLQMARACRGSEDYEGAAGAFHQALYYYNYNVPQRQLIEREWRAMIDDLLRRWEKDVRAKIDKDRGLRALVARYPLVILHSRRYGVDRYIKSAYSFIDETSDDSKQRNGAHILFDNGGGGITFEINMTTDQRNLVVDLGPGDFMKDPDPRDVDPDSDNFWVPDRCKAVEGHVYLERVCDDGGNKFYVVLQVIAADAQSRYLAFVWRRLPGGKVVKRP
ncbi:MAG TPA: tetratricopeptide repeat protein [Gemmataceae bacterium]|nr:tetratricopeptide repeat protein [Gemmataceae bacterium]